MSSSLFCILQCFVFILFFFANHIIVVKEYLFYLKEVSPPILCIRLNDTAPFSSSSIGGVLDVDRVRPTVD